MVDASNKSTVAIARPANVTPYSAGDVIGVAAAVAANAGSAILEFAGLGNGIQSGNAIITGSALRIDVTGIPAGMTSFRLHLYDAAPDAILDNAAWDLASAGDRSKYLGYVDLGSPADVGSTLYVQANGINKNIKLKDSSLYGVLVTIGGYTPTSGAVKSVTLYASGSY